MPESLLDAVAAEKEEAINNQTQKQDQETYKGKHTTIFDDVDFQDVGGKYNDTYVKY